MCVDTPRIRGVAAVLVLQLGLGLLNGCDNDGLDLPGSHMAPAAAPVFVDDSFETLYPMFLLHRGAPATKAAQWVGYRGKWVRWTGTLVSFSANGITLKQRRETTTFDVSLYLPSARRTVERAHLHPGDRVTYVGRLDSYDDVFRTLYLTLGAIVPARPAAALGPAASGPGLGLGRVSPTGSPRPLLR